MPNLHPKRTALYDEHIACGARMVPFGGWEMPVQYSGILDEHRAVRTAAGLFDISHMAQMRVTGPDAVGWLDQMLTNNVARLTTGQGQYTFMLNERGGVIDDLIIYRESEQSFFGVLNAAVADGDFAWLNSHLPTRGVALDDLRATAGALALQGPHSASILERLGLPVPRRNEIICALMQGFELALAGTGYTGESGCEIFAARTVVVDLWKRLLNAGAPPGLKPCGLGARDTLRLEMCYPLNGSDLSPDITPIEAGLAFFVDLSKDAFIGRDALVTQKLHGPERRLCALLMAEGSPPPRPHYPVVSGGKPVSELTSGALSPTLGRGIALAYLPRALEKPGTPLDVEIRGRHCSATVVQKPFLQKPRTP